MREIDRGLSGRFPGQDVRTSIHEIILETLWRFGLNGEKISLATFDLLPDIQKRLVAICDRLIRGMDLGVSHYCFFFGFRRMMSEGARAVTTDAVAAVLIRFVLFFAGTDFSLSRM